MDDSLVRIAGFGLAVTPAAILAFFIWARRTHSIGVEYIAVALGLGACAGLLVLGVEVVERAVVIRLFENIHLRSLATAFFVAGLTEELAKLLALMFVVMRHEDCRTPLDILCGAALVGLGFAALENTFYVVGSEKWRLVGTLRSLASVPLHAALGIILGYFLALAKIEPKARRRHLSMGLLSVVGLHGLFDWPLMIWRSSPELRANDLFYPGHEWAPVQYVYWSMLSVALLVAGIGAVKSLESRRIQLSSRSMALASARRSVVPILWRVAGIVVISTGLGAPGLWHHWRVEWATVVFAIPWAILPAAFGIAIYRYGALLGRQTSRPISADAGKD